MLTEVISSQPLWAVLTSIIAAVLILFSDRHPNLREFWTLAAAVAKFAIVLSMVPTVVNDGVIAYTLFRLTADIDFSFRVDAAGLTFGMLASLLWILTSIYSIGYMRTVGEHKQTRYFASFALSLSSTMGIAFAGNLLTFVLFYELLTIATYPLVIHKETPAALAAGRKYLAYTIPAGLVLIIATAITYVLSGSLDFTPGGFLADSAEAGMLRPLFWLFVLGFGAKAAIMPMHGWLPSAMIAPTPVSALLHAVAVVKAGVFAGLRIIGYVFGPHLLNQLQITVSLSVVASITIILASLIALIQDNLKLRLAYSTVAHLSYIVLGAALLTPSAWAGAMFHIVNHAFMKITLFFTAGAIYALTGKERVSELDGIGRRLPLTLTAFFIGSLGLAGLPPVGGFLSKWYLGAGAAQAGLPLLGGVLLLSGLLNTAYLFPIVYRAFFRTAPDESEADRSSYRGRAVGQLEIRGLPMVIPLMLTAIIAFMLGSFPDQIMNFWTLTTHATDAVMGGMGGQ